MNDVVFAAENLTKRFGRTAVLDRVSLKVRRGEIVAVVGHNGAGKSTLVKVMAGYHAPDEGKVTVGERSRWRFLHQNLALVPSLSVMDNLALDGGYGSARRTLGVIRWSKEERYARALLAKVNLDCDPAAQVETLTMGQRVLLALARAVGHDAEHADLLVLDEATASLNRTDAERLFAVVRAITDRGPGAVCVLHNIAEVVEFSDRVVVLRDGAVVTDCLTREIDHDTLLELLAGEGVATSGPTSARAIGEVLLSVDGLCADGVRDVSFSLRAGEVLGVAGLVGSGVENLLPVLAGAMPIASGRVHLRDGRRWSSPEEAIAAGVVMVPGNRDRDGCISTMSVQENISLPDVRRFAKRGIVYQPSRERAEARRWIERLQVQPRDSSAPVASLSGGNQQKVVFAKWLRMEPRVFLLEKPMQGVDVRARRLMEESIREVAASGAGVIIASPDHEELARLSHRVIVLRHGEVTTTLTGDHLTDTRITTECFRAEAVQDGELTHQSQ
jgi:ribose transport system ATP-binding protein